MLDANSLILSVKFCDQDTGTNLHTQERKERFSTLQLLASSVWRHLSPSCFCHLLVCAAQKMHIFPLVGCSTLQMGKKYHTIREHNTKHNHTTHNNQHEPQPPYPPAALPSLSPWVEQWHHQIMAPPLPDTIRRRRAVGLALAVVGLIAWGGEMRGIEK